MFTTELNYRTCTEQKNHYIIEKNDLIWSSKRLFIRIVQGFITDFASTPKIIWGLLPPMGKYSKAVTLHDFIYATGVVSKLRCERIFWKAMAYDNVTLWKRLILILFTTTFGWIFWFNWKVLRETNPKKWSKLTGLPEFWVIAGIPPTIFRKVQRPSCRN